ncbi:hypothetical protein [Escherichia coli]|uniref:hypothetical protein n=1 Tax=Escherichia coli TaxID=562 RepID=UPI001F22AECE|nr:hypothetical protein [Escherichia coli]
MKELLFEMQEERRDEWIAENYPDAEEGTPEWDAAAQEYSWFQDWMEEAAEQQYFEASLASIPDRLQDAKAELDELESLMQFNQPRIVERMAYVHCVSVPNLLNPCISVRGVCRMLSARYEHLLPWRLKPFCRKMHYTGRMMAYSEITAATPSISVFTEGYVDDFASR